MLLFAPSYPSWHLILRHPILLRRRPYLLLELLLLLVRGRSCWRLFPWHPFCQGRRSLRLPEPHRLLQNSH